MRCGCPAACWPEERGDFHFVAGQRHLGKHPCPCGRDMGGLVFG
jgi:hypothetical protein